MRVRRFVAALLVLLTLGIFATPALGATITYPTTVGYSDHPTLKVTGLKAKTDYLIVVADRFGQLLFGIPVTSGTDGSFTFPDFGPDQTDQPGAYTFWIVGTADNVTAATVSVTLNDTSTWFTDKRLGS